MYKFTAEGTVKKILEPKACNATGFVKRSIIIENNGKQLAPEFHPKNFRLLTGLREGDHIKIDGRMRPNKNCSAHFLVAESVEIN